jgi:hypothetical protein
MEAVVLALQDELKKKNVKLVALKGKFERIAYVVINCIRARFSCREVLMTVKLGE